MRAFEKWRAEAAYQRSKAQLQKRAVACWTNSSLSNVSFSMLLYLFLEMEGLNEKIHSTRRSNAYNNPDLTSS